MNTTRILACCCLALAIVAGLTGRWCLTACLTWSACQAWTWNDENEEIA